MDDDIPFFDGQVCLIGESVFQPIVCLGGDETGYNTVAIPVSLLPYGDLNFEEPLIKAKKAQSNGFKIIFDLDLGLFDRLKMHLESDRLFSALTLSLESFQKALLAPFASITLGVIVYKGTADFYQLLKNDYSLIESFALWVSAAYQITSDSKTLETSDFGRLILTQGYFEMGIRFIEQIREPLNQQLPVFVLLDFQDITDSKTKAFLLNRERLGKVLFAVKNADQYYSGIQWDGRFQSPFAFFGTKGPQIVAPSQKKYGILLPAIEKKNLMDYKEIGETIDFFIKEGLAFRMIPESYFVSEWDEVDLLFVPKELSQEGLRMVKGYLASQGELIALDSILEIPDATLFNEWRQIYEIAH